jgi:hypothetical protein
MNPQSDTLPDGTLRPILPVPYSKDENEYRNHLTALLTRMQQDRDQAHPELDGMTYLQYYESNRKKDLSYIAPKKNKQDVRIVTGTTREKDTTLVSTMLNLNLEPDITAFNTEDLVEAELGDNMTDLVLKSRQIEEYARLRPIIYRELISQGDAYVQELWVEEFRKQPLEMLDWDPTKDGVSAFSLNERLKRVFAGAKVRLVNGKKIYVGNIRIPYLQDQREAVAVLNIYSRAEARLKYSTWERWKYVPRTLDTGSLTDATTGVTYKDWNIITIGEAQVAELMVFMPSTNRFMLMLNGVMLLPINYPLTAINPTGEINIGHGKFEPISDFFCGKSQPSKLKIDQDVLDETTTLMIEGMRQMRKPPMGNKSRRIYSPDIFHAGKISNDVKPNDLFPILPEGYRQISPAEFNFYNLIKTGIDQKSANPDFSGEPVDKKQTAYEADQQRQQQMLKLGLAMDGVVHLERSMTWNRIHTILTKWTRPIDPTVEDIQKGLSERYRNVTVSTSLENGQAGIKMFRFQTDEFPDARDQHDEEEQLSKDHGQAVRVVYINPEALQAIRWTWYIQINPVPRSGDKLSQLMFVQNLQTAIQLFGPDAINLDYAKQRFAILTDEDYNKLFKKMDIMQMLQQDPTVVNNALGRPQGGADVSAAGTTPTPKVRPMITA